MRGEVNVGAIFCPLRRHVHSGVVRCTRALVVDTDSTPDVQIITPLIDFFSKHRSYLQISHTLLFPGYLLP